MAGNHEIITVTISGTNGTQSSFSRTPLKMLVEGYDNLLIELIGIEIITETDIAVVQTHLELDMFLLPFISITHTLDGKESSSYMFTFIQ